MQKSDFYYELPDVLIARHPTKERTGSRLMRVHANVAHEHGQFLDVIDYLQANDLLVLNNTRVLKARLFGLKESGGKVELLVERILSDQKALVHARTSKALKLGNVIQLQQGISLRVLAKIPESTLYEIAIQGTKTFDAILEAGGEIPLPPYMQREAIADDLERYQTVYAKYKGSVAAPTAGLHFDNFVLDTLKKKGVQIAEVTLHVGAGTFQPVRVEDLSKHKMHAEHIEVSDNVCQQIKEARAKGGRIIAVGTTSLRALETACQHKVAPYYGETSLFITPGYSFKVVDMLLTNFHLPGSTLLMLVCAFAGFDTVMQAYKQAIERQYRFYSYGDAMLLTRSAHGKVVL